MQITTTGVVLKTRNIGEQDRIITLLSKEHGVIEASAKNVKRIKSGLVSSTQVLGYSEVTLFCNRDKYYINSAHSINSFYNIRMDVKALSLALYFCELITYLSINHDNSNEVLRLLLNTLSFIDKNQKNVNLLKPIFELRLLSLCGFMPDLVCCRQCVEFENKTMYFNSLNSNIVCKDCGGQNTSVEFELSDSVFCAMKHIIYSPFEKLFSFNLSDKSIKSLSHISQAYVLNHIEKSFKSLDFYLSIGDDDVTT